MKCVVDKENDWQKVITPLGNANVLINRSSKIDLIPNDAKICAIFLAVLHHYLALAELKREGTSRKNIPSNFYMDFTCQKCGMYKEGTIRETS